MAAGPRFNTNEETTMTVTADIVLRNGTLVYPDGLRSAAASMSMSSSHAMTLDSCTR